jgi:hypothetical protein
MLFYIMQHLPAFSFVMPGIWFRHPYPFFSRLDLVQFIFFKIQSVLLRFIHSGLQEVTLTGWNNLATGLPNY